MKVDLTCSLADKPGMLLKALEPISQYGGNIVSVHHKRGSAGRVPVEVLFKVRDHKMLDAIIHHLDKDKIKIADVRIEGRKYYERRSAPLIFIGHVIDRDIQDTIDRLNKIGMVSDVDVRMADPEDVSSVWMIIDVEEKKLGKLSKEVGRIVDDKEFLAITDLGVLS